AAGDGASRAVRQRRIDKTGQDIVRLDQIARQLAESPSLVSVHDQIVLAAQQPMVKVDDAADEFRRKNANAAVVQKINAARPAVAKENSIVAEMRIAVDHAEAAEREPPGGKHRLGE